MTRNRTNPWLKFSALAAMFRSENEDLALMCDLLADRNEADRDAGRILSPREMRTRAYHGIPLAEQLWAPWLR